MKNAAIDSKIILTTDEIPFYALHTPSTPSHFFFKFFSQIFKFFTITSGQLCIVPSTNFTEAVLALLDVDYISAELMKSKFIRRPSVCLWHRLSPKLLHGFLSNFSCGFSWAIWPDCFPFLIFFLTLIFLTNIFRFR